LGGGRALLSRKRVKKKEKGVGQTGTRWKKRLIRLPKMTVGDPKNTNLPPL